MSADSTYDRENTAAYQRGAASFWESETKRTREKVAALERQKRVDGPLETRCRRENLYIRWVS